MLDVAIPTLSQPIVRELAAENMKPSPARDDHPLTIVANSSIQFFDLAIDAPTAARVVDRYFEARDAGSDSDAPSLFQVELDESGAYYHPATQEIVNPAAMYAVDGRRALRAYLGQWLPIPVMRVTQDPLDATETLGEGPSNWARIFIARDGTTGDDGGYRIVLAIDTALEPPDVGRSGPETSPSLEDARAGRLFRFSAHVDDIGWFVTESWVDEWIAESYRELRPRASDGSGSVDVPAQTALEHLAHYLTLLNVLQSAGIMPELQFIPPQRRTAANQPVAIDLVLDIGASRTCALISEASSEAGEPASISHLPRRDLTAPQHVHSGYFSSRIEFARASLGRDVYSRWSGRTSAFYWPSIARVGDEAQRLAAEQTAADAFTGLSSPMRYLWDERPSRHVWRFSGPAGGANRRSALIAGHLLAHLSEAGDVLEPGAKRSSMTKPRFSRSSLLTFFAAELIQHALSALNSPIYRQSRPRPDAPRRISRIVVVVPTAMQAEETAILKRRLEAAVRLVWHSLGWTTEGRSDVQPPPLVEIAGDAASLTQLAFLNNEIAVKFHGNARQYLGVVGRIHQAHGSSRSLRIATLDIGGGSSSLAVATYALVDGGSLLATPQLLEGFPFGGDDVLKALVEAFVLPALEQQLVANKLANARQFLKDLVNDDTHGRASRLGEFRRRFAGELALPAAIALLREHETLRSIEDDRPAVRTLRDLLAAWPLDTKAAADELESLASDAGSDGFQPLDTEIVFTLAEVALIVKRLLAPVLANAVRAIRNLDCDVVLLSGWLSRLPVVKEMFLEGMPIRPDRILAMHEYRMGDWFPSRLANGNIHDPKALAAVGALLASQPSLRIGGVSLMRRPSETSRQRHIIGRIGPDGLIADDAVLFDAAAAIGNGAHPAAAKQATIAIEHTTMLGLRRAPLAAWPAMPMYALALDDMAPEVQPRMPVRVTLEWNLTGHARPDMPWVVRATDADGIELALSEIGVRLQTLSVPDGHWLDTGVFAIA